MDEYCLIPRKMVASITSQAIKNQSTDANGRQPPDSSQARTLTGLVERICQRQDINDWEKADLLSSSLEHFMAWQGDRPTQHNEKMLSIPQSTTDLVLPNDVLQITAKPPNYKFRSPYLEAKMKKRTGETVLAAPLGKTENKTKRQKIAQVLPSVPEVAEEVEMYEPDPDMEVDPSHSKRKMKEPQNRIKRKGESDDIDLDYAPFTQHRVQRTRKAASKPRPAKPVRRFLSAAARERLKMLSSGNKRKNENQENRKRQRGGLKLRWITLH
jgi:hypothetical protein